MGLRMECFQFVACRVHFKIHEDFISLKKKIEEKIQRIYFLAFKTERKVYFERHSE